MNYLTREATTLFQNQRIKWKVYEDGATYGHPVVPKITPGPETSPLSHRRDQRGRSEPVWWPTQRDK